ncbi:hypothetical protein EDM53_05290 [Rickettsiales endosymbiont of Peranema trichophorum]|nr:hypothetical protein EDM53_05290 [Rickettsiales endosymbiont of Peranema trichophorum]
MDALEKEVYKDNAQLKTQLLELQDRIKNVNSMLTQWTGLQERHVTTSGLKIEYAKSIIDQLRQSYLINNLEVNISSPVLRRDVLKKYVGLEYSEVAINFGTYVDIEALQFIDELVNKMPGIVHITRLRIVRLDTPITEQILIRKEAKKDMVQVKLNLIWHDLKSIISGQNDDVK